MERVGHGIFAWDGKERRTDRYGSFVVGFSPYESSERVAAHLDLKVLSTLLGKRVHVACTVVKTRPSGHIGDLTHKLKPSTPDVGESVDLGVGTLGFEDAGYDGLTSVLLKPEDGRKAFWIDPRKFYRLHDQTVDLFIVETDEPFSPVPCLQPAGDADETVDIGDGSFQAKTHRTEFRVAPDILSLGDGAFIVSPPTGLEPGRRRRMQ
jgi:hypothetical protein